MNEEAENYVSEYENEFGEPWIFEYDYTSDTEVVEGLDVGWIEYPVIEGRTFSLKVKIRDFDHLEVDEQKKIDNAVKEIARFKYLYFRDMGLGK